MLKLTFFFKSAVKIDLDQNYDAGFYESLFTSIKTLLNESLRNLSDSQDRFVKNFRQNNSSNNQTK